MTDIRFSYIFGPELYGRQLWFGRLRWVAVSGLALAAAVGPWLGFTSVWPSLFVVASVVAAYNVVYQHLLRRHRHREHPYANLRLLAIGAMLLDLGSVDGHRAFHRGSGQSPAALLRFSHGHRHDHDRHADHVSHCRGYLSGGPRALPPTGQRSPRIPPRRSSAARNGQRSGAEPADPGGSAVRHRLSHRLGDQPLQAAQYRALPHRRDILRERTDELQRLLGQIERLEERKSHYMRISAHQLRSPVGTIKAALQVLVDGYVEPSTERGQKLLRGAAERADGLLAIINDLLDLAKIREGRGHKAPWNQVININQMLDDLFAALQPYADERGVELLPDFEGVAILAWGLPPDLVHAFENLVYNAIKYSDRGGRVTVRLRVRDETCTVRFIDEGIGIPAEYVDQVFFEFVRAPNAKRHAAEGTGLGLAIVKEVIEAHGGRITARSRSGAGSTFTVRLALAHVPTEVQQLLQTGNEAGYMAATGADAPSRG